LWQEEIPPNVDENVAELRERERRKNKITVFNTEERMKDDSEKANKMTKLQFMIS